MLQSKNDLCTILLKSDTEFWCPSAVSSFTVFEILLTGSYRDPTDLLQYTRLYESHMLCYRQEAI